MRRHYVLGLLAGTAVGLVAFGFGVQGWRPILMGIVVAGFVTWVRTSWPEGTYLTWPALGNRVYGGGSHQVARLAVSISHRTRSPTPDPGLQHRLRRLATTRLQRLGVAWDDARAPELLGREVHEALADVEFNPDVQGTETIIAAIERLSEAERTGRVNRWSTARTGTPQGTDHSPGAAR